MVPASKADGEARPTLRMASGAKHSSGVESARY